MKIVKTVCPFDCFDQCALEIKVDSGRAVSVNANPLQPVTGRFICSKGKQLLERAYHPDRLLYPLWKCNGNFKKISWQEALDLLAQKLKETLEDYGPLAFMHYYDGGSGGLVKNIESRFFSALGGNTVHHGSLCWAAGIAAQRYDFGEVLSHPHHDLLNSRLIIIWGRNPAYTQGHLLPFIRSARRKGTKVILIDPIKTATAAICDRHLRVKPASDGALALGMAREIISTGFTDPGFIEGYCSGYEQFAVLCEEYTLEKTASLTGLPVEQIAELANLYASSKPAAILIGIGLQRHSNGGNTVRAIDALAALTGNIGLPGGGASYVNFRVTRMIDHAYLAGEDLKPQMRYYPKPQLAKALEELDNPPVRLLYISRANPLVQIGNSRKLQKALEKIPFIVTADHFMTDTAQASDLVLPAAGFMEREDLFFNSMSHQYLGYAPKIIDSPGECRWEVEYLSELAAMLGVKGFPEPDADQILSQALKPFTAETGYTLDDLKLKNPLLLEEHNTVPWREREFLTGNGKYNFYSQQAEEDGVGGLPAYREPFEISSKGLQEQGYCYWLVTPHPRHSIHSIHRLPGTGETPKVYLSENTAFREKVAEGERVWIESVRGRIEIEIKVSSKVPDGVVMIYEGWWQESGAAVNNLTDDRLTDMGTQAAFYDCLCRIRKVV